MKILIIEDETPAASRLERLVKAYKPEAEVVKIIDTVEDAVECLKKKPEIDLIFMDIQLADGLSFEIFNQVEVIPPVIFTTAYDHYAVKAFRVNSVDYLLKPVDEEELKSAIEKYERLNHNVSQSGMKEILAAVRNENQHYRRRFLVKTAGRLAFIQANDVSYFFSEEGVTFIVTLHNERYLLENTLEELEQQLDPGEFFRINRKMIIASKSISRMEPYSNNRLILNLNPAFAEEVVVSRHRTSEFKHWLDS